MLEVNDLSKSYGSNAVFMLPKIKFGAGVTWIKGHNGSGKSTLLKILAGLIDFKGIVVFDGKVNLRKHPIAYRKLVNFAESEPLFPHFFTGWDMINLFLKAKDGSIQALSPLLTDFNMDGYLDDEIGSYSAGMLKKLSLAMAFAGKPRFILLDEPFITLDEDAILKLAEWITKTMATGTAFVITSHQNIPPVIPINSTLILQNGEIKTETATCL